MASQYNKDYYETNKERIREQQKTHRNKPETKAKRNAYKRKRMTEPAIRERELSKRRARQYGLTVESMNELLTKGCQSCGSFERLVIDHCHNSNRVRGCLCNDCNLALGFLKDNPQRILNLHKYSIHIQGE